MKVVALDFGAARTGVAVSDPTGTIARPFGVVERAGSEDGLRRIAEIVAEEEPDVVIVGLPLTLRGERGLQAAATDGFVSALRAVVDAPVELWDERFTTALASQTADAIAAEDARAAAHLLQSYLTWATSTRR